MGKGEITLPLRLPFSTGGEEREEVVGRPAHGEGKSPKRQALLLLYIGSAVRASRRFQRNGG